MIAELDEHPLRRETPPDAVSISVIGCGHLGTVQAATMSSLGHDVVGIDSDVDRVAALRAGRPPFAEPGLAEMLGDGERTGRLRFVTEMVEAASAKVHVICIGTPQRRGDSSADLQHLDTCVDRLLPHLKPGDVVVGRATVPVGNAELLAEQIRSVEPAATLVWVPELLREGHALEDTLSPDRLIHGVPGGPAGERAVTVLNRVYAKALANAVPLVVTDYVTAQLVTVAARSFLATRISFTGALAELCEATGADVIQLADCLPRDIRAFMIRAEEPVTDESATFLREVGWTDRRQQVRIVDLAREACGGSIVGRRIAVLGAASTLGGDDVRSPALRVAAQLTWQGADVVVTDPRLIPRAFDGWLDVAFAATVGEAVRDADLVLLTPEWPEHVPLDPQRLRALVARPRVLDGRTAPDVTSWRSAGWTHLALGRS